MNVIVDVARGQKTLRNNTIVRKSPGKDTCHWSDTYQQFASMYLLTLNVISRFARCWTHLLLLAPVVNGYDTNCETKETEVEMLCEVSHTQSVPSHTEFVLLLTSRLTATWLCMLHCDAAGAKLPAADQLQDLALTPYSMAAWYSIACSLSRPAVKA